MRLKLSVKMPLLVVGTALAAGLGVALLDYSYASKDAYRAAQDKLAAVLQARVEALTDYRRAVQRDLQGQAGSPFVALALASLEDGWRALASPGSLLSDLYVGRNPFPSAERSRLVQADDASAYSRAHGEYHGQLRHWTDRYGYRDLIFLDLEGHVLYSVRKQPDFAADLAAAPHRDFGLARAFRDAATHAASGKQVFADFEPYGPGGGETVGFVAATVFGANGRPIGVLALELSVDRINEIMRASAGLGRTGETIVVGRDLKLRASSKLQGRSTSLEPSSAGLLSRALAGEAGVAVGREAERDQLVAFAPLDFLGTRWVVAAKADLDEVYAPIQAMRDRAVLNGAALAIVVAVIGFAATRFSVVRPIEQLMQAVRLLATGGHGAPVTLSRRDDEIGDLGKALAVLRESLIERDALAAERHRETLLIETARRFRTISETLTVAVVVAAIPDGAIRYANPAAVALLRLPGDGLARTMLGEIAPGAGEVAGMIEAALQDRLYQRRASLRCADGSAFPGDLTARFLELDGAPCMLVTIVDLTEQQAAAAEIERHRDKIHQAEKLGALGSLLAGVAHELNNPLSVLVAQANLLEETVSDPQILRRTGKIQAAAHRCARIVRTFLAMARQRPPSRAAVDVNQAVDAALELVGYGLRTAGIELVRDDGSDLPPVWADPDQIGQVLVNLIVNAQQALVDWSGPRRLVVATRLERDGNMVQIALHDSGPGVPVDVRPRIFEPFFTTKPAGVGTGIGLALCHGIVASHGGTIQLEDRPEGGACFVVRLPIGDMAPAPVPKPVEPERAAGQQRVLVIDDEPDVIESLADILSTAGYRIDTADSGRLALERLEATPFDAVLSDVRMPDIDGPTLYRRAVERRPDLAGRFIMVTGDTMSPAVRDFIEKTRLPCLEKPFMVTEVRQLVAEVIEGGSGARKITAVG